MMMKNTQRLGFELISIVLVLLVNLWLVVRIGDSYEFHNWSLFSHGCGAAYNCVGPYTHEEYYHIWLTVARRSSEFEIVEFVLSRVRRSSNHTASTTLVLQHPIPKPSQPLKCLLPKNAQPRRPKPRPISKGRRP